jgi:TolA-binding protein
MAVIALATGIYVTITSTEPLSLGPGEPAPERLAAAPVVPPGQATPSAAGVPSSALLLPDAGAAAASARIVAKVSAPGVAGANPATGRSETAAVSGSARDAAAIERLDIARAKLADRLLDQGVADLRQIVVDFPRSDAAVEASFMAAEALQQAGRDDDAMAVLVEFDRRFATHERVAESQLRRAQLMQRSKTQARQSDAYALFGVIARAHPGTPQAKEALIAKRQIERQRRQLRAVDPVIKTEVPALLVTLRDLSDQFPRTPEALLALNELAGAYEAMHEYQAAVDVLERMAEQFPGNPTEVWFKLGELYGRRLKDAAKARAAYTKVPAVSPRYREAQQRLAAR